MVFVSHTRPAPHMARTTHSSSHKHSSAQVAGTKRGEQCHHRFRCWFGLHCRGLHTDPEVAHFHKCDLEACQQLSLQQPTDYQQPSNQQQSSASIDIPANQRLTEPTTQPRRRKHRRLRKGQRAKQRQVDRVGGRRYRKARRQLEKCGPTRDVAVQVQPEPLRNRTSDVNNTAAEVATLLNERQQLRTKLAMRIQKI